MLGCSKILPFEFLTLTVVMYAFILNQFLVIYIMREFFVKLNHKN